MILSNATCCTSLKPSSSVLCLWCSKMYHLDSVKDSLCLWHVSETVSLLLGWDNFQLWRVPLVWALWTEAGRSLSSAIVWSTKWVPGHIATCEMLCITRFVFLLDTHFVCLVNKWSSSLAPGDGPYKHAPIIVHYGNLESGNFFSLKDQVNHDKLCWIMTSYVFMSSLQSQTVCKHLA